MIKLGLDPGPEKRRPKYGNKKTEVDGLKFDSIKEAERYSVLARRQRMGEITNLELQRTFEIVINDQKVCGYRADFVYDRDGIQVVEDVKSIITAQKSIYILKRKLLKACLGIVIVDIHDVYQD